MHRLRLVSIFVAVGALPSVAEPLDIHSRGHIRSDYSIDWTEVGPPTGEIVPNNFAFTASDGGQPVVVHSDSLSDMVVITGGGGFFTSGPLLWHPQPGVVTIYPLRGLQGFGVTIESIYAEKATYTLDFFTEEGESLGTATAESSGTSGEPVFLGLIDPAARIEIVQIRSGPTGPNAFVLSDPVFQRAITSTDDPAKLPVVASFSHRVDSKATYLHEGIFSAGSTPATLVASVENPNVVDLQALNRFPGLRGGDVLRFRASFSGGESDRLMGLLSRTQEVRAGTRLTRVPGALDAGRDYPTPPIPVTGLSIATPTDLGSDFVIGSSTFVEVPADSRYLMFSLARPHPGPPAGTVQVDWIPRTLWENWVLAHGLVGDLAALEADPDGDGLSNIEEFAYGKDPTVDDSGTVAAFAFPPFGGLRRLPGGQERLQLTFGARRTGPVRYRPAFSSDLVDWDVGTPDQLFPTLYSDGGSRAVFLTTDPTGGQRRFGRILVDYIPPLSQ